MYTGTVYILFNVLYTKNTCTTSTDKDFTDRIGYSFYFPIGCHDGPCTMRWTILPLDEDSVTHIDQDRCFPTLDWIQRRWIITTATRLVYAGRHAEAEFLDEIQTKGLRDFLLVIHSHLYSTNYSFAWDLYFFKSTQPLDVSVKEKGGKPDKKP